jgi:hypothetical protein
MCPETPGCVIKRRSAALEKLLHFTTWEKTIRDVRE